MSEIKSTLDCYKELTKRLTDLERGTLGVAIPTEFENVKLSVKQLELLHKHLTQSIFRTFDKDEKLSLYEVRDVIYNSLKGN